MYYQLYHATRFRYNAPVSESVMEVRMQPRTDERQRCHDFRLFTAPTARLLYHHDVMGNTVHHFDIPKRHQSLTLRAHALVEVHPPAAVPDALPLTAWDALDQLRVRGEHWDLLNPSPRTHPTPLLYSYAARLGLSRDADPLTLLRTLNRSIHDQFAYSPEATEVDSPIDLALSARQGVCQDFAHIMIAIARGFGIPARYISGYLFYQRETDRSLPDASHAWIEALLPSLGWVGFDPTNDILAGERHIRVAIGRDYDDVPPTRGVFKGSADSELDVEVVIEAVTGPPALDPTPEPSGWQPFPVGPDFHDQ